MERSLSQSGENPIKQATTSQIWSVVSRRFANHQCRRGYVHYPRARVEVVKLSGRGSSRFQDRNMVLSTDEKRRAFRKELTAEVRDPGWRKLLDWWIHEHERPGRLDETHETSTIVGLGNGLAPCS